MILMMVEKDWFNGCIEYRFDLMIKVGVLDEVCVNLKIWDFKVLSVKIIGVLELICYV